MFLKLAALNIRKHLKRTLLIGFAVIASVVVMLLIESLMEGIRDSFFENLYQGSGHVQIHGRGHSDRADPLSLRYRISNPDSVMEELRAHSGVLDVRKVVEFGALLVKGEQSMPMTGFGVESNPAFFQDVVDGMVDGHLPDESGRIAVSTRTAELLGLSMDEPVMVMVEDSMGRPFYREYRVSGLFHTGARDYDTRHFFLAHSEAESLLYLQDSTTEIRVELRSPNDAGAFVDNIRSLLRDSGLEAQTWQEIHGSFAFALEFFDLFVVVIDLMVVVVAAMVITNAILMNVFERTAEYGTLRAIGMKKRQQLMVILTEGVVEGGLGSLGGLILGVPLVLLLRRNGIYIGELATGFGLDPVLTVSFTGWQVIRSVVAGCLIAVAGSLYAASVSVRMRIVDMFGGSQ